MKAIESGQAPAMPVTVPGGQTVVAAVFCPGGLGTLDSHVVVYEDDDDTCTVHYLIYPEDDGTPYLHQGAYDLTYAEALEEMVRRLGPIVAGRQP